MAALSEQLDRACSGVGTVVLVEGDAGMGKSRLLEEAAMMASRRRFRVGMCAAEPGDAMVELATLMAALFVMTAAARSTASRCLSAKVPAAA
jgi:predicted ATPase